MNRKPFPGHRRFMLLTASIVATFGSAGATSASSMFPVAGESTTPHDLVPPFQEPEPRAGWEGLFSRWSLTY
jgi:hypothetical protein